MTCIYCYCSPCVCQFKYPITGGTTIIWPFPLKEKLSDEDIAKIAEKVVLAISAERKELEELEELRAFKAGILALVGMK